MLRTALIRGAFDYQGQKCSAASRAFVPRSVWQQMGDDFLGATEALTYGDVTDLSNYGGAVIDERAFAKNVKAIERAKGAAGVTVAAGGEYDDSEGYFVRPTVLLSDDPDRRGVPRRVLRSDPGACTSTPTRSSTTSSTWSTTARSTRLTGAVIADDRAAVLKASERLRYAAGNFYVNDKPTGAVVGQQPFGGVAGLGHQRQGRVAAEPAALDVGPLHQGDVRPGHRPHLPAHGGAVMAQVFDKVARPAILAASRSHGLRRTAERMPVTRRVVDRFVPGETVDEALKAVAALRDSGRFVTIDYLGEDVTDSDAADATVRGLPGSARRRRTGADDGHGRPAAARGVAEALGAGAGAAARRREDRAGERAHHLHARPARSAPG